MSVNIVVSVQVEQVVMAMEIVIEGSDKAEEPTWEIARLFPAQGNWSVEEYLALDTNYLVEFSDGYVEVLPMPTDKHQAIVAYLFLALVAFARKTGGTVRFAPLRVRLWPGKFREPDLVFMSAEHGDRRHNQYWEGADLVVEVVSGSEDDRQRDLVTKRREYAQAGIPEYWIVDPRQELITVLQLSGDAYTEHGRFGRGTIVKSASLAGFEVPVDAVLDAE